MGGGLSVPHRHQDWQLDVDTMTYEQLLALGDKIGRVNTGLDKHEINQCIGKYKFPTMNHRQDLFFAARKGDEKCSICLEKYGKEDELGKLKCGHEYHFVCIKQWVVIKNTCPICRNEAADRSKTRFN